MNLVIHICKDYNSRVEYALDKRNVSSSNLLNLIEMYLIHINITKNNIIISITTLQGNVILQKTAGSAKFRSEESNTQLTTSLLASYIAEAAKKNKINLVGIYIKGTTD